MLTLHSHVPSRTLRRLCLAVFALSALAFGMPARAQDWVHIESSNGVDRIRIAAAGFKPLASDPATIGYKHLFDLTLYSDLNSAGIFDLVSQSLAPMVATRHAGRDLRRPVVCRSGQRGHGRLRVFERRG